MGLRFDFPDHNRLDHLGLSTVSGHAVRPDLRFSAGKVLDLRDQGLSRAESPLTVIEPAPPVMA